MVDKMRIWLEKKTVSIEKYSAIREWSTNIGSIILGMWIMLMFFLVPSNNILLGIVCSVVFISGVTGANLVPRLFDVDPRKCLETLEKEKEECLKCIAEIESNKKTSI